MRLNMIRFVKRSLQHFFLNGVQHLGKRDAGRNYAVEFKSDVINCTALYGCVQL